MSKQYYIRNVSKTPEWAVLEKALIDQNLWRRCEGIYSYAQLAYDKDKLYVHLHADERRIRAENYGPLDQPCRDSCLEFFLSADEKNIRYLNIEINPNLCIFFGFGTGRNNLMRILLPDGVKTINANCSRTNTSWDITYELSFSLLQLFFPDFTPTGRIRGNFYKCGDLTEQPHYYAWNYIKTPTPDFHRPEYFGEMFFLNEY